MLLNTIRPVTRLTWDVADPLTPWAVSAVGAVFVTVLAAATFANFARQRKRRLPWFTAALLVGLAVILMLPLPLFLIQQRIEADLRLGYLLLPGLGLALLGYAVGAWSRNAFFKSLPTSPIEVAAHGFVRIQGKVVPDHGTLTAPDVGLPAVYYHHEVEELRESRDSKGRSTRSWHTIHQHETSLPFRLEDESGGVPVGVEHATYMPNITYYFHNGSPVQGFGWGLGASVGDQRSTVRLIVPDEMVTVFGRLHRQRVGFCPFRKAFFVIGGFPGRLFSQEVGKGFAYFFLGVLLAGAAAFLLLQATAPQPGVDVQVPLNPLVDLSLFTFGLGFCLLIGWIRTANALARWRRETEAAWAEVDVALKRRFDLIPNLVETARAMAAFEQDTLTKLVELRGETVRSPDVATRIKAENRLEQALAVFEKYPKLRSSEAFLRVQRALIEAEELVADARETYNAVASNYNELGDTFPNAWVAAMIGAPDAPLFEATHEERTIVPLAATPTA